jgi:hypothetical protein
MSLAEVKERVLELPVEEQAELASFLASRFRRDDPEYRALLTRLIDDRDPNHWVRWEDVKKRLKEIG